MKIGPSPSGSMPVTSSSSTGGLAHRSSTKRCWWLLRGVSPVCQLTSPAASAASASAVEATGRSTPPASR